MKFGFTVKVDAGVALRPSIWLPNELLWEIFPHLSRRELVRGPQGATLRYRAVAELRPPIHFVRRFSDFIADVEFGLPQAMAQASELVQYLRGLERQFRIRGQLFFHVALLGGGRDHPQGFELARGVLLNLLTDSPALFHQCVLRVQLGPEVDTLRQFAAACDAILPCRVVLSQAWAPVPVGLADESLAWQAVLHSPVLLIDYTIRPGPNPVANWLHYLPNGDRALRVLTASDNELDRSAWRIAAGAVAACRVRMRNAVCEQDRREFVLQGISPFSPPQFTDHNDNTGEVLRLRWIAQPNPLQPSVACRFRLFRCHFEQAEQFATREDILAEPDTERVTLNVE